MKALWKGMLTLKSLAIPVQLYSATQSHALGFTLLCTKCHTPIRYKRYCTKCKKEIAWHDVVKGLKMPDGSYFVLTQEKLAKMKPVSSSVIDIFSFISIDAIASIYFSNHYYLAPQKVTEKAYFLLKESMQSMHMAALVHAIIREKEYVCALQPYEEGFLFSTLHYEYEIRSMNAIEQLSVEVKARASKKERELIKKLIATLTKKEFNISKFKDTFVEQLKKQIKKTAAGRKALAERARKALEEKMQEPLLAVLQESLHEKTKSRTSKRR